jgi:hypothetical protein
MTIPTMMLWYENKDQDWYKALPTWEKAAFWHFRIGENTWRLPKPFLWGALFASWPESVLQSYEDKDPEAVKEMSKQIISNTIPPVMPPFVSVPFALGSGEAGYDYFRDRPIVSQSQVENLPPSERNGNYTSETAKKLGKLFNVSPSKIDYGISGFTGGLGTDLIQMAEKPFVDKPKSPGLENALFIGRLVSRSPFIGKFYDELDKATSKKLELNVLPAEEWTQKDYDNNYKYKALLKISSQLSKLRKDIVAETKSNNDAKTKAMRITELQKQMEQIARDAIYPK